MANPKPPQPERKPSAAGQPPASAASRETKRPTDSVPIATGTFAKLPMNFGRYQVEKLLGKGAMGAVYLALDTHLGRRVAIKIPKLSANGSPKLLKRLKTEAMAAAQIDHPSVCPVYDSGDIEGIAYIAMQFIEGETLKDHLQKQAKTPAEAVDLVLHLADGLAEAHSKKIYHRDLKPDNIKLNRRGVPVIMDFGLAKLATTLKADASATQAGTTLGTPAYMSPEQASGQVAEIDHRSDLYALGIILFEMLTGQWPFSGRAIEVMGQKSILDPPSPLTIKPDLDPQLAAVCHKLIAKKREDRYQDAKELIAALQALGMGSATQSATGSVAAGQSQTSVTPLVASLERLEQEDAFSSMVARKRREANRGGAATKLGEKTRRITKLAAEWWRGRPRGMKWIGLAAAVLLAGLIGLWAGGIFVKVPTKEGTLVLEVNEPGAEVFVDGKKADVIWADGTKKATVQVKAGERQVDVKKDGFSVVGKKMTFKDGEREIFKAKLVPVETVAEKQQPLRDGRRAGEVRDDNGMKMKLVWCPQGKFTMGSLMSEMNRQNWENQVEVTLTKGFWLGKCEVTQMEWERVMESTPWKGQQLVKESGDCPATYLNWDDAAAFCRKLTTQERKSGRLPDGWEYMLPTEAQWEYACRAGSETRYTFGNSESEFGDYAWFRMNAPDVGEKHAHEVGTKKANAWGLHDMHGNVYEWCEDAIADKLPGGIDPLGGGEGSYRVGRGGGYDSNAPGCRSARRTGTLRSFRHSNLGVRVALRPARERGDNAALPAPGAMLQASSRTDGDRAGEKTDEADWTPLFNGKDLQGFLPGPGRNGWFVSDGVLGNQAGSRIFTEKSYTNFILKFDFQVSADTAASIDLWSSPGDTPLWVFIDNTRNAMAAITYSEGEGKDFNVFRLNPPAQLKPNAEWNEMTIEVRDATLTVSLNGKELDKKNVKGHIDKRRAGLPPAKRYSGSIGLSKRWGNGTVTFRKIEIKELRADGIQEQTTGAANFSPPENRSQSNAGTIKQDRKATLFSGSWKIEGNDLIKTDRNWGWIQFGDPVWQDYDFSYEIVKTVGQYGVGGRFRFRDLNNFMDFDMGAGGNTKYGFNCCVDSKSRSMSVKPNVSMLVGRKYRVLIKARKNNFTCFLDDELILEGTDDGQKSGAVGFIAREASARFSSIKVTAPDGQVLWSGPPELPGKPGA